jgi:hypothetical protein
MVRDVLNDALRTVKDDLASLKVDIKVINDRLAAQERRAQHTVVPSHERLDVMQLYKPWAEHKRRSPPP